MDKPREARQRAGNWLWPRDNTQLLLGDGGTGWIRERLWWSPEPSYCWGQGSIPQGTELSWH